MNSETIVLLSTLTTGILALIGVSIRYCYLSKCAVVSCCFGCYKHERNIEAELTPNNETLTSVRNMASNNV